MVKMIPSVDALTAEVAARDGARIVIGDRVRSVRSWLKRIERGDAGEEAVRRLRTTSRRTEAALLAFGVCLDDRRARRVRKLLKRVRRSAGRARDLDVQRGLWRALREECGGAAGDAAESMRRRGAEARIAAIEDVLRLDPRAVRRRLKDEAGAMLERARKVRRVRLDELGAGSLRALGGALAARIAEDDGSAEAMHRTRIEAKRLRYALELFRGVLDAKTGRRLARGLARVHDSMGRWHDLVVAMDEVRGAVARGELGTLGAEALLEALDERSARAHRASVSRLARFESRWLSAAGEIGCRAPGGGNDR